MKINDKKSVRGFFLYSDFSRYEDGDFVVYGNTIYVCSPKTGSSEVIGEKPYESENFYVYLGDQISSVDEFKTFVDNNGGDDKYISLSTLVSILNTYLTGINNSGIIGHEYTLENGEVIYKVNNKISEVYGSEESKNILSTLLLDKNINHGIFKVSKNLPEIVNLVGDHGDYCILRQYSYYLDSENKENLMRVQELIDIEVSSDQKVSYANIYYRSAPLNSSDISNLNFQSATAHSYGLERKISKLTNLYSTRMRLFDEKIKELQENFCFTDIKLDRNYNTGDVILQNTDESKNGYINITSLDELGPITLNILTRTANNVYQSNTITVETKLGSRNYYINDDLYLKVELNNVSSDSNLTRDILLINGSKYNPLCLGLGEFAENSEQPAISYHIDLRENQRIISVDIDVPTNNLTLDFQAISEDSDPIIIDYLAREYGDENSSFKTIVYKPDGSLAPGELEYKYFDFGKTDNDEKQKYLLTLDEISQSKNLEVLFKDIDKSFDLTFKNNTGITLYFPSINSSAGENGSNFEIPADNSEKVFNGALIPSLSEKGIYFYSKELSNDNPNLKLSLSISIDDVTVNTIGSKLKSQKDDLILWGSYSDPIVKYGDFSGYIIDENSKIIITIDLVETEQTSEDENISSVSEMRVYSPNREISTVSEEKNSNSTPSLNIGEEITQIVFRLAGINAKDSQISSAYCRKYFKPL